MIRRSLRIRALIPGGPWSILPGGTWSRLNDAFIFAVGLALFYGIIRVAQSWFGPFTPQVEISRNPVALCFAIHPCPELPSRSDARNGGFVSQTSIGA